MENDIFIKSINGIKMPWMIYGTAWKKENTAKLVIEAVKNGFRGIDTAAQPKHYQEDLVGVALQALYEQGFKREGLYLQTKYTPLPGQDPNSIPYDKNAPIEDQVRQSFENSLKNLQTSYVDTFILHTAIADHVILMKVWEAMQSIQKEGGALQLGISNCYDLEILQKLYNDAQIKPAVIQNRFYHQTKYDKVLRQWCDSKGIIYQSFWSLTANPHILQNKVLIIIAQKYNKTPEQIFFRYLSLCGIVPLTGTCSSVHMKEDLSILDFILEVEEVACISYLLG